MTQCQREEERTVRKRKTEAKNPKRRKPGQGWYPGSSGSVSKVGGVYSAECLIEVKGHQDMDLTK